MGATSINHNCSLTWQAATEYKRPWSSAKRKAKAIYLLLLFRQSVPVFHSFCLIFDVESLLVLGHICQKVLDNHLNMYPEGIKNLPHEHVEVEHLLRILCINLLLLPVDGVARSKWWDLIPRLANMPNKCAFPWFIIAHSSCSQITSRRSNFRNKRAANAKAPCLQKTLHVRDICIYSHATACTLHHLHVCVQICVYEIARNSIQSPWHVDVAGYKASAWHAALFPNFHAHKRQAFPTRFPEKTTKKRNIRSNFPQPTR